MPTIGHRRRTRHANAVIVTRPARARGSGIHSDEGTIGRTYSGDNPTGQSVRQRYTNGAVVVIARRATIPISRRLVISRDSHSATAITAATAKNGALSIIRARRPSRRRSSTYRSTTSRISGYPSAVARVSDDAAYITSDVLGRSLM